LRDSDSLDQLLAKNSFLMPDCLSDAVMADMCGLTDRVCHGREDAPQDFFFVYTTFFADLHITLPFDDFTMGSFGSSMWHPLNCIQTHRRPFRRFECFVTFLNFCPHLTFFYIIIIPVGVLLWAGCLCLADRAIFDLLLLQPHTIFLKKSISKILWSRMADICFIMRTGKPNFLSIGRRIRPSLVMGCGHLCHRWINQFW